MRSLSLILTRCLSVSLILSFWSGSTFARVVNHFSADHLVDNHLHSGRSLKYKQETVLYPPNPKPFQGFGGTLSMDSSGTRLVVGSYDKVSSKGYIGAAYVYEKRGSKWKLMQRLAPRDAALTDKDWSWTDGLPVDISGSGSTILLAYPMKEPLNSSVDPQIGANLYRRKSNEWKVVKKFRIPVDEFYPSNSGTTVSLDHSGKTALIASFTFKIPSIKNIVGAAYIFEQASGRWTLSARLTGQSNQKEFRFGYPAMLDGTGTTMIASSSSFFSPKEYVYIFRKKDGAWKQVQRLLGPEPKQTSEYSSPGFGIVLAIDDTGKVIAIADSDGNIYTYEKTKTGWRLFSDIKFPLGSGDRRLLPPSSMCLSGSGSTLVVGAQNRCINCGPSGVVIIYRRGKNRWKNVYRLEAPRDGTDRRSNFGKAVAADRKNASTLAVGQPESNNGDNIESGHAYVYSLN